MVAPLKVTWEKFRGFTRPTTITFPKLTVLIGRNNVGKTSAYAPLLLLRQTLDARDPETSLLSRGQLTDVGSFNDYSSNHDPSAKISLTIHMPELSVREAKRTDHDLGSIQLSFDSEDGKSARLWRYRINNQEGNSLVSRTRTTSSDDSSYRVVSPILPATGSTGRPFKEITALRKAISEEQPQGFLFSGINGLLVPRAVRADRVRWESVREWFNAATDLYDVHADANNYLLKILNGIVYVGPLRSLPQGTYRMAAEAPRDVGRDGEYAPEMLYRLRDTSVKTDVDAWLKTLGYGELEFNDLGGGEYFQTSVRNTAGLSVNIAHSGVGLSQVLPLLVGGLMAKPESTFIAQQPEIHLNPAQQCLTMDFLIDVANTNRRVVVETHSEHVLLRLRRRIAEGRIKAEDVAVYYFDNSRGRTTMERVEIGEKGEIPREAWPTGFFEEQVHDSFKMAMAQAGITDPS